MLRSIRLLFRTFTPVEIAVLDSVVASLPAASSVICQEQIAAINKVQRYLDWTEVNFYRINATEPGWNGVPLFRNHDEFTLSKSTYTIDHCSFTTQIICVGGHIFSFVTRASIKRYCFGTPYDLQTTVLNNPTSQNEPEVHSLPKTYTEWHANRAPESNGWSVLPISESYLTHLADGDYIVLDMRGDEFLLFQVYDKDEAIYYASTTDSAHANRQLRHCGLTLFATSTAGSLFEVAGIQHLTRSNRRYLAPNRSLRLVNDWIPRMMSSITQ